MFTRHSPPVQLAESDDPIEGPDVLVAFDFDGTMTTRDSFLAFLRWRSGWLGYNFNMLRLAPAAISFLFHHDRGRLKAAAARLFLRGVDREKLERQAAEFATEVNWSLFRPDALRTWRYWRSKGGRVVIVTASPETTVAPFARSLGAHKLIGTVLEFDANDRVTGAFASPNCRGSEKVRRLREVFGDEVTLTAAYGDTTGDKDMLLMAEERGYRVFSGKPA
jgi:phosphatidylglycerophosphatase C